MKKNILVLLLTLLFLLCGCAGGNQNSTNNTGSAGNKSSNRIYDDTNVMGMTFAKVENAVKVERFCEYNGNNLYEKDITYTIENDKLIGFAASVNEEDLEESLKSFENEEINGKTYYFYASDDVMYAFIVEEKNLYAINVPGTKEDAIKIINTLNYEISTDTKTDDVKIDSLTFEFKDKDKLYGKSIRTLEDVESGNIESISTIYKFGEDDNNQDYRILARVYKNSALEENLNEEKTYEDKEINGQIFKALVSDDGKTIEYWIQKDNDTYQFRNLGSSNGWFTNRSDESHEAFEEFIKTVKFS